MKVDEISYLHMEDGGPTITFKYAVLDNANKIVALFDTHAEAWRHLDRLMGEPISKREDTAEWIANKD